MKSVIDIDVDDSKFKQFSALWEKYHTALGKTPNAWRAVGEEQSAISSQFEKMTAALLAQNHLAKENEDADKKRLTRLTNTERLWTSIAKSSATMSKNVLDISGKLLTWGSVISGGLLGGSLFGLDRLGRSASNDRRSAMGLGLSIGQQKAFALDLGRFVNPDSFLSGISGAVGDVSKQGPLYSLGVDPNQSVAQVAIDTMNKARALARATPANQMGTLVTSRHLEQLGLGVEDLRRMRSASPEEWKAQMAHYGTDAGALGFGDKSARTWTDFMNQLDRAGNSIFKTFVTGLIPLTGPLEHLSGAFVKTLGTLMQKNGLIEKGIGSAAHWIDSFSKDITGDKFQSAVSLLISDTGTIAEGFHGIAVVLRTLGIGVGAVTQPAKDVGGMFLSSEWRKQFLQHPTNEAFNQFMGEADKQFNLPPGLLEYERKMESGSSFNPGTSKAGAKGVMQLMPAMAKRYGVDPNDPLQSVFAAGQLNAENMRHYKGDLQKVLAAYNAGAPAVDQAILHHPTDWRKHLPKETQNYSDVSKVGGIRVVVTNNTGGSANVSINSLAGGP